MKTIQPTQATQAIIDFDRTHLWHPYTSMTEPLPAKVVESARGVYLQFKDGPEVIDGMASWWTAIHGYNHPVLNGALTEQANKMSHVMFGGLTHEPAVELGRKLLEITPPELERVFFCDSGSVSVEAALKMAIQYQYASGKKSKNKFLTIRGGYHGDTFGAMSVCDPVGGMHELFTGVLPQHHFADRPRTPYAGDWEEDDISSFRRLIETHGSELAGVILEPLVQGAGGMYMYSPEYLKRVRELCDENDVLLIFDEIATGFGRTGELFACILAGVTPDILCVGKALTGGYMTLAATLARRQVAERIGVFNHGPTYMANPLACGVALASLNLLLESDWRTKVRSIEAILKEELLPLANRPGVADVRVLGAIGAVELESPVNVAELQEIFISEGVWLRPFGKLVYTMPPYITKPDELRQIAAAIKKALPE